VGDSAYSRNRSTPREKSTGGSIVIKVFRQTINEQEPECVEF
jgi:hypothetical protein